MLGFDHTGCDPVLDLLDPVRQFVKQAEQQAREEIAGLRAGIAADEAALGGLRTLRQSLEQASPEPVRTPEQRRAREALAAAAIPFSPLYETLDFAAGLEDAAAGWTEVALTQTGLLDALVVDPARRAEALDVLRQSGCGEGLLLPRGAVVDGSLARVLAADPQHPLAGEAMAALRPGDGSAAGLGVDQWRHGLLEGTAAPAPGARFIGRTARERHRLAEIARLEAEMADIERMIRDKGRRIADLERRTREMDAEWSALEKAPAFAEVEAARHDLRGAEAEVERERERFDKVRRQTEGARALLEQC